MSTIVHVSETLATGVLSIISTLMAEQVKAGHDVVLIGSSLRIDTPADWRSRIPATTRIIELPMPQQIGWADAACALALRRWLRALRPDAVHLHSSKAGAIGRLAHFGLPGRVIYQPHGLAFMRSDVSVAKQMFFGWIEAALALLPGEIVACSQGEAQASRRFLAWRHVHMVPNGIDLGAAVCARPAGQLSQQGRGERLPVVGTCGRISPQKNPEFFAEVAHLMRGRCEFRWIGGGDYPEGAQALHEAGVQMLGWRSREQVLADLNNLDLYVQTSAWEGMPVSVMEAMACGLPVVVTAIAGNRDLIEPVDPESVVSTPAEMAKRLQHWIDLPQQSRAFGDALRKEVLSQYAASAMSGRYEVLYGVRAA